MSFRDVGACLFKDKKRDFIESKPYSLRPSINTKFKKGKGILIFKKKGDVALSFHLTQFRPRLAQTENNLSPPWRRFARVFLNQLGVFHSITATRFIVDESFGSHERARAHALRLYFFDRRFFESGSHYNMGHSITRS